MIVAIHQPQYLPWLGYFDKMQQADVFCYLDNVQYKKNEWQNRNRIKTAGGWQWLTVPVSYRFPQKINEVKINHAAKWAHKHLQALLTNYSKAPFYKEYIDRFENAYTKKYEKLSDLNIHLIEMLRDILGLSQKATLIASQLSTSTDPTRRLIELCRAAGGDTYLAGRDGARYMDLDLFADSGIKVVFQDFNHPAYPQLFGNFESHLSVVDLLFNCGPESMEIIRAQR